MKYSGFGWFAEYNAESDTVDITIQHPIQLQAKLDSTGYVLSMTLDEFIVHVGRWVDTAEEFQDIRGARHGEKKENTPGD